MNTTARRCSQGHARTAENGYLNDQGKWVCRPCRRVKELRKRQGGEPGEQPRRPADDSCHIDDCGNPYTAHGLCKLHYRRWSKWGDPYYAEEWAPGVPSEKQVAWVTRHLESLGYTVTPPTQSA